MPNILQYKNTNCTTLFNAVTSGVFSAFCRVHSQPLSIVQKGDNRQELDQGGSETQALGRFRSTLEDGIRTEHDLDELEA